MNIQSNINSAINQIASVAGLYSIAKQKKAAEQARAAREAKREMQNKTKNALQEKRLALKESQIIAQATKKHGKEMKTAELKLSDGTPISALGAAAQAQIRAQLGGKKNGK